jgi:hypothetical protein
MKLFSLCLLFISFSVKAEIFEIHSLVRKVSQPKIWIIKFTDGRVGFWDQEEDVLTKSADLANSIIDAHLSEGNVLSSVHIVGKRDAHVYGKKEYVLPAPPYSPSVYPSYAIATDVLHSMRRTWTSDAQCYDRAHIWVYEEFYWTQRALQKVFLFFSDSYIDRYNFGWWFHVSPFAMVNLKGEIVERVMDAKFAKYPLKFKLWTDIFMKNKAECKVIGKYSDYSTHPGEEDCYLMKASMYFWQPRDLEDYETNGFQKTKFIRWEVKHAFENGFGIFHDEKLPEESAASL